MQKSKLYNDKKNNPSPWLTIKCGVAQGSVLEPLLFFIYIDDFQYAILKCKYNLYADDLFIYIHSSLDRIDECITELNSEIELI